MAVLKHILITAGGTTEPIDTVRRITNMSTGSLCACVYDALATRLSAEREASTKKGLAFRIHYVVSKTAVRPDRNYHLPVTFYEVSDAASAATVLEKILADFPIAAVVHGMAVSDFTTDYVTTRDALISELLVNIEETIAAAPGASSATALRAVLESTFENPQRKLDATQKVRSDSDLVLALKRTPKLIGLFKNHHPDAFLIGFKLLNNVPEAALIEAAATLGENNGCDLILANDAAKIQNGRHEGLLLKGRAVLARYETKQEIAEGLAGQLLSAIGEG
ncbi:hypothetical protein IZU99_09685 [Oscillospiraceae bacterium CM]|nr:hypothetical protein IZU99_09685 [Oscillospiraceae bacterium CM]